MSASKRLSPGLFPFKKHIAAGIKKIKILKDLEDVAMIDRRAKLFGRNCNSVYLSEQQFLLFKGKYATYFGKNSDFYGHTPEEYRKVRWTNIKDLDLSYVKKFLEKDYYKYC